MAGRHEGRTAIVTGASRGIGLAIGKRLVDEGAHVVVTGRKEEGLDAAVDELGGSRVALGVTGHAADAAHQADTVERAIEVFGSVDMLINNTGINPIYGPLIELDLEVARKVIEVNALAALSWAQHVYRSWMSGRGGAIVNVSSVSALRADAGIGLYGASKAMLSHMTQQLAVELAPDVRVNAVAPALVKTRFATALYEGREDAIAATYPLKRLGTPQDIGSLVSFLLSEDAGWITGQVVVVDGGLLLPGAV